ncbi:MAG: nickel pincer cofactor biosynthesis protein LarC [Chloroflexi bacterium]|nr:nickel pincer cofactor biosynthesis protein LarC [Chloroflexota bacterium]MYE39163.1 nickel pincer cofactor biosynthesis protein LarC [Chloroflexota bacterium]
MTKIAYIQPIGGASGDMLLGALVDAGLPLELLRRELAKLPVDGYALAAAEETRCEIRGTHLKVHLEDRTRYSPAVLLRTVETSPLNPVVKEQASEVLRTLWKAEARVHGEREEALELEELGSVDTLVDVVGFCAGLRELGVDEVYAAPLVLGEPSPPRRVGGYSNPAPATLELIAASGAPVAADSPAHAGAGELTTPTGAALITTLSEFRRPAFSVQKVGVGLGTKDPPGFPNALRVWLGETADAPTSEEGKPDIFQPASVLLLETNLDDAPGLVLGYAQERLFALGALDVWHTPVQMKKNRPGAVLSALVPPHLEQAAVELILRETPTLGIRSRLVDRYVAHRHSVTIETELGPVSVKVKRLEGVPVSAAPEPDDCRRIAIETGLPFQEVYQRVAEAARQQILD